jgi:hypothetical protein
VLVVAILGAVTVARRALKPGAGGGDDPGGAPAWSTPE